MQGIIDRIENDRDDRDLESRATEILSRIDRNRKESVKVNRELLERLDRIDREQTMILWVAVSGLAGWILCSISLIWPLVTGARR